MKLFAKGLVFFVWTLFAVIPCGFSADYDNMFLYNIGIKGYDDYAVAIAADDGGNIYVASYYIKDKEQRKDDRGKTYIFENWDISLAKYPPFRNLALLQGPDKPDDSSPGTPQIKWHGTDRHRIEPIWENDQLRSEYKDYPSGLALVKEREDGKEKLFLYMSGYTMGDLEMKGCNRGGTDYFLAKFDAQDGRLIWLKQGGGEGNDVAMGVDADSFGNIYITGSSDGNVGHIANKGGWDRFLIRYDRKGRIKSVTTEGSGQYDDYAMAIKVDSKGSVYTAGYVDKLSSQVMYEGQPVTAFVSKYVPDLLSEKKGLTSLAWTSEILSDYRSYGIGITVRDVPTKGISDVYMTGVTCITGCKPQYDGKRFEKGDYAYFLQKISDTGNVQWTNTFNAEQSSEESKAIALDIHGNIFLTGFTDGVAGGRTNYGENDLFLLQVDPEGNTSEIWQMGSQASDEGYDLLVDNDDNVVIVGSSGGKVRGENGVISFGYDSFMLVLKSRAPKSLFGSFSRVN